MFYGMVAEINYRRVCIIYMCYTYIRIYVYINNDIFLSNDYTIKTYARLLRTTDTFKIQNPYSDLHTPKEKQQCKKPFNNFQSGAPCQIAELYKTLNTVNIHIFLKHYFFR